ncbi:MAG: hypothetical protein H6728_12910 [Myxococcales bacterium]|nr:hypothetical protein [Myxococcales bacterium]
MSALLFTYLFSFLLPTKPGVPTPPAKVLYRHTLADANLIFSAHLRPISAGFFDRVDELGQEDFVKNNPGFSRAFQNGVQQLKDSFDKFSKSTGIDPIKDIHFVTVSLRLKKRNPHFLVSLGGKFNEKQSMRLAKWMRLRGKIEQIQGYTLYKSQRSWRKELLAYTPDGQLLFGNEETIQKHIARGNDGTGLVSYMTRELQPQSMITAGTDPNVGEMNKLMREVPGTLRVLLSSWKAMYFGSQALTTQVKIWTKDEQSLRRTTAMMRGLESFSKASDHTIHGFLKILDAVLEDDASKLPPSPVAGMVLQHKKAILRLIYKSIGNKMLQTQVSQTEKGSVTLHLKGRMSSKLAFFMTFGSLPSFFLFNMATARRKRGYAKPPSVAPARPIRHYRSHPVPKKTAPSQTPPVQP